MFDANKKGEEKENGKGKRIEFMEEDAIFALHSSTQDIFSHLFNQTAKL